MNVAIRPQSSLSAISRWCTSRRTTGGRSGQSLAHWILFQSLSGLRFRSNLWLLLLSLRLLLWFLLILGGLVNGLSIVIVAFLGIFAIFRRLFAVIFLGRFAVVLGLFAVILLSLLRVLLVIRILLGFLLVIRILLIVGLQQRSLLLVFRIILVIRIILGVFLVIRILRLLFSLFLVLSRSLIVLLQQGSLVSGPGLVSGPSLVSGPVLRVLLGNLLVIRLL